MKVPNERAPVWAIWLLIAFAAVQPLVWNVPGGLGGRPILLIPILIVWLTLLVLAALATRRITWLWRALTQKEHAHRATLSEVEQLQTQNAMLEIIARSVDVPLAFQELASRIERLVPCDRVGLALLSEDGQEFHTYTARAEKGASRSRTRPEIIFKVDRTIIGNVVRSREPFITGDMQESAATHLDANVVSTAGFRSALIIPLMSTDRAVGTLSVVSRRTNVFDRSHIAPLLPIAEILAVAWVAQQLQMTIGKYRTIEAMSDLTLSVSAEINSALQTIIGHCDLLARATIDSGVERDLGVIVKQARRIATLLEKMRTGAHERLREVSHSIGPRPRAGDPGPLSRGD
jgi:transcriptional regulator with GAF, ATPase, and Fis domain